MRVLCCRFQRFGMSMWLPGGTQRNVEVSEGSMSAKTLMVLGCSSDVGKSWLTCAISRLLSNRGLRVAPFKAQNMSDFTVGFGGGEISSSQYVQAVAARCDIEQRLNPVLIKPGAATGQQILLDGVPRPDIEALSWHRRKEVFWPHVTEAFDSLCSDFDVVVVEGAGSPAEINLRGSDIVNMAVAQYGQIPCLLAADIDRGGAFAHLYGTWALLDVHDRRLIKGFVLNKFRGDASLLEPAPQILTELTGVERISVVPLVADCDFITEDSLSYRRSNSREPLGCGDGAGLAQAQVADSERLEVIVERLCSTIAATSLEEDICELLCL